MNPILPLHDITDQDRPIVGGKAFALASMAQKGLKVPNALCISTEAYRQYVQSSGLRNSILLELYRKSFEEMRWEEIWDLALRIRNMFLKTPMPSDLLNLLKRSIGPYFRDKAVSVRSSAPGEDSSKTSFAGLHESFVNVRGTEAILRRIVLVWASLWSDRALLYRQELGLDVEGSAMAVVVQEMILGERSGVVFGQNPSNRSQAVLEAVYGLNQGLVDGTVEPDHWVLDRNTGKILSHRAATRIEKLSPGPNGVQLEKLAPGLRDRPPLKDSEVSEVYGLARKAESLFGWPQDMEWTYSKKILHPLQARPITTRPSREDDERSWFLSLHRSFENLKGLHRKIEDELIPAMTEQAERLAGIAVSRLSDTALADEIERRRDIYDKWLDIYRQNCIPFAHGMRLFGQVYNDVMKPQDPFEFVHLLEGSKMVSLQRNQILEKLAQRILKDPQLAERVKENKIDNCDPLFQQDFKRLLEQFGDLAWGDAKFGQDVSGLSSFLAEMASRLNHKKPQKEKDLKALEKAFLSRFGGEEQAYALKLIEMGRASYRLRDDDNIYLGKIEGQWLAVVKEGKKRVGKRLAKETGSIETGEIIKALRDGDYIPESGGQPEKPTGKKEFLVKARQIVGQPAGPGLVVGKARLISRPEDLFAFKAGEILVCDAVDPGMTFVVPLASGIVERRGGMLIHGAIIAREYGLPCVTGAADAGKWIKTGDTITVDGHLGIVIIGEPTIPYRSR